MLVLGDFGAGSDAPIVLDYGRGAAEPVVRRLQWTSRGNRWVDVAPTFGEFLAALGLDPGTDGPGSA